MIGWCVGTTTMIVVPHSASSCAVGLLVRAAVPARMPGQCAFFPCGIVSMMDMIAAATMSTLNMSAIIAAVRIATLS